MVKTPFASPALLADPLPPDRTLVLTNARLFDGTGAPVREGATVIVENGIFTDSPSLHEAVMVDLDGRFVMPGLIDVHTHLAEQPEIPMVEGMEPLLSGTRGHLVAAIARGALRMGITTLRDVGARDDSVLEVRQAIRFGAFLGPRILACGRIVSATSPGGRHFEGMYREADGPDEMRKAVREQIRRGADFVKIMMTGARSVELENPEHSQVTRDEVLAVVDEAHRQGYRVAAHCEGLEATVMAIEAGVDTVEHGFFLNERPEMLEKMAENGQILVPTLSFLLDITEQRHDDWSAHLVDRGSVNLEQANKTLVAALEAGVLVAMGFDSKPETRAAAELALMVRAGMSTVDALVSATSTGARALGLDHLIGIVQPGKLADLVVIDGDPTADISVLVQPSRIQLVLRSGHVAHASAELRVPHNG